MASVAGTLALIKSDPIVRLAADENHVEQLCRQLGHRWRERILTPMVTLRLFLLQVLHGNTAITHLRRLAQMGVAAASYCEARTRLPLQLLQILLERSADALVAGAAGVAGTAGAAAAMLGQRVFIVDASSFSTPDTPELREHFGTPTGQKGGCGFPVAKILGLLDAASGMFLRMLALPLYTHEMSRVSALHEVLRPGDLVLGDRGLSSWVHLALLQTRQVFACFRLHQRRKDVLDGSAPRGTTRLIRKLGKDDQLQRWSKPKACPKWMDPNQFALLDDSLLVRVLRYTIAEPGMRTRRVSVVTTLLDPQQWPAKKLAELYGIRWRIETCFNHLKTTMKMNVLKCKTVQGVLKELTVYLLIWNLVRAVMLQAARLQRVSVWRISLIDAVRLAQCAVLGLISSPTLVVNPARPGRHEPRVIKRRMKEYDLMSQPREQLRQKLYATSVEN